MGFKEVVAAGVYLVREALRSPNYMQGQQGWTINRDGSSEFSDVTIRGTVIVGNPPDSAIKIFVDHTNSDRATIYLYSGDPNETAPGALIAQPNVGGGIATFLYSPRTAIEGASFIKVLNGTATQRPQVEFAVNTPDASGLGMNVKAFGDIQAVAANGALGSGSFAGNVTAGGIYNPGGIAQFNGIHSTGDIIGDLFIYADTFQATTAVQSGGVGLHTYLNVNQLQAFNGGAASPLYLNWSNGGAVNIGTGGLLVNGTLDPVSITNTTVGGVTLSGGVLSNSGGTSLGSSITVGGGQINAVGPGTGATPGTGGVAYWDLVSGTTYRLKRNTSSRRYKDNIGDLTGVTSQQILGLRPRQFQRTDDVSYVEDPETGEFGEVAVPPEERKFVPGFIAEEAAELGLTSWVYNDSEGRVDGFSYDQFIVAHQLVLREHEARIAALEAKIEELTK